MWNILLILAATSFLGATYGQNMLGPGRWLVLEILETKESPDDFLFNIAVTRKKMSRTQDFLSLRMLLENELNSSYTLEAEVYKEVDGGFKYYQTLTDDLCSFLHKFIGDNFRKGMELAGIDPPDCPFPVGDIYLKEIILDYEMMPEKAIYGKYDVSAYIVFMERRVSCVRLLLQFSEVDDED